jgi:hypothetical protein
VSELFRHEKHPGITHLVSDVKGELKPGLGWRDIFDATMPRDQSVAHLKVQPCESLKKMRKNVVLTVERSVGCTEIEQSWLWPFEHSGAQEILCSDSELALELHGGAIPHQNGKRLN